MSNCSCALNFSSMKNKNVLGGALIPCCFDPLTGYFRDGYCKTLPQDTGTHVICAIMTPEFLSFTRDRGNDLITPIPQWQFRGLRPGDKWCLCVSRWLEAERAGLAPKIILEATHAKTLEFVSLDVLKLYAVDSSTNQT